VDTACSQGEMTGKVGREKRGTEGRKEMGKGLKEKR
jgi:hypothetical protein